MKSFKKTVFLLYLFAYLQIAPAFEDLPEEVDDEFDSITGKNSSKALSNGSKTSIRVKRWFWSWLGKAVRAVFKVIVVVVIVAVIIVTVVGSTIKDAAKGAVVGGVLGGISGTIAGGILGGPPGAATMGLHGAISGAVSGGYQGGVEGFKKGVKMAAEIGNRIKDVIQLDKFIFRRSIDNTNNHNELDEVAFDLQIIDRKVNKNYDNAVHLKQDITSEDPDAESQLIIRKDGFDCDEESCKEFGEGLHAVGICSPYICECKNGIGEGLKCDDDSIYDPVYMICDDPRSIKICGL